MTTTPPADLADLEALDVDALDGEQLAEKIALIRGWRWYVTTRMDPPFRFLDNLDVKGAELWDGQEDIRPVPSNWGNHPRPDRDEKAAVQLLNEGVERWGGVQIAADMEEWEAGGLYQVGFPEMGYTWFAPFCVAVCRAYLLSWQAERKAENESA